MGTEDLNLDLKLMSSIFQMQIHNLRMARECVIEGQQLDTKPNIAVGDLVLVRDHTSKCFMPKYKVDFCIVRIEGNKIEVKDINGKLCWYHISDVKKNDMVMKLVCQLPDVDALAGKADLVLIQSMSRISAGHQMIGNSDLIQITLKIFQIQSRICLRKDLIQCS